MFIVQNTMQCFLDVTTPIPTFPLKGGRRLAPSPFQGES